MDNNKQDLKKFMMECVALILIASFVLSLFEALVRLRMAEMEGGYYDGPHIPQTEN